MITRIEIDGFKTFSNFEMEFTPFTIIAGANASGKSNLFDALQLISNLADKDLRTAFNELRGEADEQFTRYSESESVNDIKIAVEMLVDKTVRDNWGEESKLKYTRLRYEINIRREKNQRGLDDFKLQHESLTNLKHQEDRWVISNIKRPFLETWRPKVPVGRRGIPYIDTNESDGKKTIKIPQDGKHGIGKEFSANDISQSALSSVNSVEFPHIFAAKMEMLSWRFLQLNPDDLRKPSPRTAPDRISPTGANLASALYRLQSSDPEILNDISIELNNLLPNFTEIKLKEEISENKFIIKLVNDDGREFSSRVLSEGTLRLLTLCILKYDDKHSGIICFEEPENGIHPFRLDKMITLLRGLSTDFSDIKQPIPPIRQIIVNTHSPGLIRKIFKNFNDDKSVSVWFSRLITKIDPQKKLKFKYSKFIPVNYSNGQFALGFNIENEGKITELEVQQFLETRDTDN